MKIALIQMSMSEDQAENVQKAVKRIKEAAQKGAKIVALPEVFTSVYFPTRKKYDAEKHAETIPGPIEKELSKAAKENKVVLVAGSIYEKDGKKFYNTAMIFDENGELLGKYRKMHIPHDPNFYEQDYFEKGDLGYSVFETKYGKIAVLICYDQWFPEAARIVSLMGAQIIFYPTAIGLPGNTKQFEGNWQEAWEAVQRGHSIANATIVATINRVGKEVDTKFWGNSFVYSQFGTLLAKGKEKEEIIYANVDLELGKRIEEGWMFFKHRRPETYGRLTKK